jgi:hypothetical protein
MNVFHGYGFKCHYFQKKLIILQLLCLHPTHGHCCFLLYIIYYILLLLLLLLLLLNIFKKMFWAI